METKFAQLMNELENLKTLIEEETDIVDEAADLLSKLEKMTTVECRWTPYEAKKIYESNGCAILIDPGGGKCQLVVDCKNADKGYAFFWLVDSIDQVLERLKQFNEKYAKKNQDMRRKLEAFEKALNAIAVLR